MNTYPEKLEALHGEQLFLRSKSVEAIKADEDLLRHIWLIEQAMDNLYLCSMECASTLEGDDGEVIRPLGMRSFNGCTSSLQLTLSGYYQNAAMIIRDILETVFLLHFFALYPDKILQWRNSEKGARMKEFSPVKIRTALDNEQGFKEKKRQKAYDKLCELASHPTYTGFQLLASKNQRPRCGPFFDPAMLKEVMEELVLVAVQAGVNHGVFYKSNTREQEAERSKFLDVAEDWSATYLGSQKIINTKTC